MAASIPVVVVSLKTGLDPGTHYDMGRALAPLRGEGVLLVASGMSFHNMRRFNLRGVGAGPKHGTKFDAALVAAATTGDPDRRRKLLTGWRDLYVGVAGAIGPVLQPRNCWTWTLPPLVTPPPPRGLAVMSSCPSRRWRGLI